MRDQNKKKLGGCRQLGIWWTEQSWRMGVVFRHGQDDPLEAFNNASASVFRRESEDESDTSFKLKGDENWRRGQGGFTLIELLTVIAIIVILAGLVLGAVMATKVKALKTTAKVEMTNLKVAIASYEKDYSIYPTTLTNVNDVTFGAANIDAVTYNGPQLENSDVLDILRNVDPSNRSSGQGHPRNPRSTTYFEAKPAAASDRPGVDANGILRDAWGSPYIITLDTSFDDIAKDPVYNTDKHIKSSVLIWSLGPDKKANGDPGHSDNKDNVLSWK